jgi:hypothetical protein
VGRFHNKLRHCPLSLSPFRRPPKTRCSIKTSYRRSYGSATAPSSSVSNTCKQKSGSTQLRVQTRGANSQQNSPLPSDFLFYPSPYQDPVAPSKRVIVGRKAALRPRLRLFLTPSSENQVQPSSGCRQGGRIHNKTRHCPLTFSSIRRPTKTPLLHQNELSSDVWLRYGPVSVCS